jgi:hypothetical protein
MAIDWEKRAAQYVQARDLKKSIQEKHKQELAPLNDIMEKLEALFLRELHASNQESAKSGAGTVYLTTRKTASLENPDEFMSYVIGGEHWDLLDRKANALAVEEFLCTNGALPPGVKFSQSQEIGVRRAAK